MDQSRDPSRATPVNMRESFTKSNITPTVLNTTESMSMLQ